MTRHPFSACGLRFEITASRNVDPVVIPVIAAFSCSAAADFGLELTLRSRPEFARVRDVRRQVPIERRHRLVTVSSWSERHGRLTLRLKHPEAVSTALGYLLVGALSCTGGVLLHGALLEREKRGVLLLGQSGAGKSTLVAHASGMRCIHDDKVAVRLVDGCWMACGVPMSQNEQWAREDDCLPIGAVYLIEQADRLQRRRLRGPAVLQQLAPQMIVPDGNERIRRQAFVNLLQLAATQEFFRLAFRLGDDIARLD